MSDWALQKQEAQEAQVAEFYQTPPWVVHALLSRPGPELPGGVWLDPMAGNGAICKAVNEVRTDVAWQVMEIREVCRAHLEAIDEAGVAIRDSLSPEGWPKTVDVVIFNSAFSLTWACVKRAMLEYGDRVPILSFQRLGWLGQSARVPWLREHWPSGYPLPKRPRFIVGKGTANADYEWHHWPAGRHNQPSPMLLGPDELYQGRLF